MNVSTTQRAIAGEFAVLSQLALRGFDANLTLGNTKGVDILVSDPSSKAFARVEVKTAPYAEAVEKLFGQGRALTWMLKDKAEIVEYENLFYCFVAVTKESSFRFFIVPAEEVAIYAKDSHQMWLDVKQRGVNPIRKFRLALEDPSKYTMPTLQASEYENRWDQIRTKSL